MEEYPLGIVAAQMILFVFRTKQTGLYFYHRSCTDWKEGFRNTKKKICNRRLACDYSLTGHSRFKFEAAINV